MSVTVKQIVDSQVHIGTLKSEAHPKTSNYRLDIVNNMVVLNPEMILEQLNKAKKKVQEVKKSGQEILVVCEKKMYATEMKTLGEKYGVSYLNYKVPGGFLTNFDTFKTRISSMNKMSSFVETEEFASLTKKEQLVYKRKLSRTKKIYEGVKDLTSRPGLVIVVDGSMMDSFVRELSALGDVESIVISSTNYNKYLGDNDIIANMLSYKSIDFVMNYILS
ncbi:MAG TPA: 30S ribosomal protein S2 [Candidatus Absconditabacterales bacterium]|nr:30S ribosomal protein S2 [Candidatus Absconditabacterales bacterium]